MQAGILLYDGADELDVVAPLRVLHAANEVRPFVKDPPLWHVRLIAESAPSAVLQSGLEVGATATYDACPPLDVLVVPGGSAMSDGPGRLAQMSHEPTLDFVRSQFGRVSVTAGVGTGVFLLAAAGLLRGRRVNTHWQERERLAAFLARRGETFEIVPERVVDDGDLITSGGATAAVDLALEIVDRFGGSTHCHATELTLELDTPEELLRGRPPS